MFKVCITSLLPPNMCSFQSGNAPSSQVQQTVVTAMCLPLLTRQAVRVNGLGRQCQVAFKTIADEDSTRCNRHHNSDLLLNTRILLDVISTIVIKSVADPFTEFWAGFLLSPLIGTIMVPITSGRILGSAI